MSLNGPLSGITFSGIASGINTQSIVQQLVNVDKIPITNLQTQEAGIQAQQIAIQQLTSAVQALQTAAGSISTASAFAPVAGASSNSAVASVTTSTGAQQGVYNLDVSTLASAQKLSSAAQTNTSNSLNLAGTFMLNGSAINVTSNDSLTSIAQKINSANVGVTASLINGGTGSAYLTLTSNNTGASNAIQMNDFSGSVLQSLGITNGTEALNTSSSGSVNSSSFSSQTTPLDQLMNLSSGGSGSFTLNGQSIAVDFSTDSLQSIASKINAVGGGLAAQVVSTTSGTNTTYQLQISGAASYTDPNNLLGALGSVKSNPGNQLVAAQDASYSLDGISLTSSSNTITSAIPGATITLLQGGTPGSSGTVTPASTTLSFSTDTTTIDKNVQNFVSAYNAVNSFISQNTQFDPSSYQSGPLFGDFTTQQVQSQISSMVFNTVPGLPTSMNSLSSLGFTLDSNNNLVFNQTAFNQALSTDPTAVSNIFGASGSSSNNDITYVSSTKNTSSVGTPEAVNITQAATQSNVTLSSSYVSSLTSGDVLTFSGGQLGSSPYQLTLAANESAQNIANQINSDSTLKNYFSAQVQSGNVVINSLMYGSQSSFTAKSGSALSGINTTNGVDVQGTINGEAATGVGQFLTGNSGNATTDGLQIQYAGTATGNVGSITYSSGIANQMNNLIAQQTDPTSGILTADNNAMTAQINDINSQITSMQAFVTQQQNMLTQEFANMETVIAQLQQQGGQLSSLLGSSSSGSSAASSSGSSGSTGSGTPPGG